MTVYLLAGAGGSGMSSLAQVLLASGDAVWGSDRNRDRGANAALYESLERLGVRFFPQDGSGLGGGVDRLVVSSAVEEDNPDVRAARRLGIPIVKRAALLAERFNEGAGLAVGGTSGKSTIAGMTGHILVRAGLDPTIVNGGVMLNYSQAPGIGNFRAGRADRFVIEADESDGSIALYRPLACVVSNVTLDHKPLEELRPLFQTFVDRTEAAAVLNADCPECAKLSAPEGKRKTFSLNDPRADYFAEALTADGNGIAFRVKGVEFRLQAPGRHNAANALAAIAAAEAFGASLRDCAEALAGFKGIRRRLETVGEAGGVTVIDDFAHNPDKIAASLAALSERPGRLLVVFQPHGYGPTRMLRDGLAESFARGLRPGDVLVMPDIYYAGGTADKSISSRDLIDDVRRTGAEAEFIPSREAIADFLAERARPGDAIVVMGARDDTLSEFAASLLERLKGANESGSDGLGENGDI